MLRELILDMQLDIEQLQSRFKKKLKPKAVEQEYTDSPDGLDDLRKINKEAGF